jgi:hypothetical protein
VKNKNKKLSREKVLKITTMDNGKFSIRGVATESTKKKKKKKIVKYYESNKKSAAPLKKSVKKRKNLINRTMITNNTDHNYSQVHYIDGGRS